MLTNISLAMVAGSLRHLVTRFYPKASPPVKLLGGYTLFEKKENYLLCSAKRKKIYDFKTVRHTKLSFF